MKHYPAPGKGGGPVTRPSDSPYEAVLPPLRLAGRGELAQLTVATCYRCGFQVARRDAGLPENWHGVSGLIFDDARDVVFCNRCFDMIRSAATALPPPPQPREVPV